MKTSLSFLFLCISRKELELIDKSISEVTVPKIKELIFCPVQKVVSFPASTLNCANTFIEMRQKITMKTGFLIGEKLRLDILVAIIRFFVDNEIAKLRIYYICHPNLRGRKCRTLPENV